MQTDFPPLINPFFSIEAHVSDKAGPQGPTAISFDRSGC